MYNVVNVPLLHMTITLEITNKLCSCICKYLPLSYYSSKNKRQIYHKHPLLIFYI